MLREKAEQIDKNIRENEKIFNYKSVQWDLETFTRKLHIETDTIIDDIGKLFVPSYQRDYIWDEKLKSKFIESLLLNIPIPYIFLNQDEESSNIEIIDWYQRIRTIYEFINNKFKLKNLEKLKALNWIKYADFSPVRKNLFNTKTLNVVFFQNLDDEQKKEMFARINTTSEKLNDAELRKGIIWWKFYTFMKKLSEENITKRMINLSKKKERREEKIELILRFFAYTERFNKYNWSVNSFLDSYMKYKNTNLSATIERNMKEQFIRMLNFVDRWFPNWFYKSKHNKVISSRTYFESIAVGVWLALNELSEEELHTDSIKKLLISDSYKRIVSSDWANALNKFKDRILAVKEALTLWKLPG